jgi:hypothetical protein
MFSIFSAHLQGIFQLAMFDYHKFHQNWNSIPAMSDANDLGQGYLDDPPRADRMEGAENKAVHVLCRYRRGGP